MSKAQSSLEAGSKQPESWLQQSSYSPVLPKHFPRLTQVDGKPKQLAWACEVLAKGLPAPYELRQRRCKGGAKEHQRRTIVSYTLRRPQ